MVTLADIAALLKVPVPNGADRPITGIANLDEAGPEEISFLTSERYRAQFRSTRAGAVIVQSRIKLPSESRQPVLRVADADLAVAEVLRLFAPPVPTPPPGVDPGARIASSAVLGPGVAVGPFSAIGQRTRIGRGTVVHPGVIIGEDVEIGEDCHIYPSVVIRERITIGHRVIINAGSVLGTDGFGYRWDGRQHVKIPQIGTVIIEDDVEIGSCVCIDRAKFSTTRVGRGTKIDNLVQIAHNVQIGSYCIIVGQVGIAGSAILGTGVVLGGQAAVREHVRMGNSSTAAARSAVVSDVEPGTIVSGMPALNHRQNLREQAAIRRLPALLVQMRKLNEEIEKLKKL